VLWSKYLPLQPFQYAGNNPVTGFDFTGLGPGDAFSSERAAAVDWVRTYGAQVSDSKVEFASAIGKGLDAAGNIFYTYNEPREGTRTGSTPELLSVSEATHSKDLVEVAYIHSHPKEVDDTDLKTTPNSLSGRDVESAENNNVNVYAYVPNGKLLVYDHTRNREGQVDLTDSPGAKKEVKHGGVPDLEVPRRVMVDEQ
jgi:hypothetical protein